MLTKGYSHLRNFLQIYKQILCIMYKRKNAQKFMLKHYLKDLIWFFCGWLKPLKGLKVGSIVCFGRCSGYLHKEPHIR